MKSFSKVMLIFLSGSFMSVCPSFGQQNSAYFDFWKSGQWTSEITIFNQDTIQEKDSFSVQKMDGKNAFLEDWSIFIGDGEYVSATVIRAFDQETKKWRLFYIDDLNAQSWESKLSENTLWFYKQFTYNGKVFYSRQSWVLESEGRVVRKIERSEDNQNWKPRYWQIFTLRTD